MHCARLGYTVTQFPYISPLQIPVLCITLYEYSIVRPESWIAVSMIRIWMLILGDLSSPQKKVHNAQLKRHGTYIYTYAKGEKRGEKSMCRITP